MANKHVQMLDDQGNIIYPESRPEDVNGLLARLEAMSGEIEDIKKKLLLPSDITVNWSDVQGKPTEFTPSTHNHAWADVTGKPTEFTPEYHEHGYGVQRIGVFDFGRYSSSTNPNLSSSGLTIIPQGTSKYVNRALNTVYPNELVTAIANDEYALIMNPIRMGYIGDTSTNVIECIDLHAFYSRWTDELVLELYCKKAIPSTTHILLAVDTLIVNVVH